MTQITAPILSRPISIRDAIEAKNTKINSHYSLLTTQSIGDVTRAERSEPRAAGHCGRDTTLNVGIWSSAWFVALIEVAEITLTGDAGGMSAG